MVREGRGYLPTLLLPRSTPPQFQHTVPSLVCVGSGGQDIRLERGCQALSLEDLRKRGQARESQVWKSEEQNPKSLASPLSPWESLTWSPSLLLN